MPLYYFDSVKIKAFSLYH